MSEYLVILDGQKFTKSTSVNTGFPRVDQKIYLDAQEMTK